MNRRQYLVGGSVVAAAGIAGCLSSFRGVNDTFQNVEQNGMALEIEFVEDSDISEVTLIHDGEEYGGERLSTGEYRASIPVAEETYSGVAIVPPGDYTIVATDRDDESYEHELELAADLEITDVEIADGEEGQDLLLTVENSGTSPDALLDLIIEGDRLHEPYDTDVPGAAIMDFDHDDHDSEFLVHTDDSLTVGPGESVFTYDLSGGTDESIESPEDLEHELGDETIPIQAHLVSGAGGDHGVEIHSVDVDVMFSGNVEEDGPITQDGHFERAEVVDFEYSSQVVE